MIQEARHLLLATGVAFQISAPGVAPQICRVPVTRNQRGSTKTLLAREHDITPGGECSGWALASLPVSRGPNQRAGRAASARRGVGREIGGGPRKRWAWDGRRGLWTHSRCTKSHNEHGQPTPPPQFQRTVKGR